MGDEPKPGGKSQTARVRAFVDLGDGVPTLVEGTVDIVDGEPTGALRDLVIAPEEIRN